MKFEALIVVILSVFICIASQNAASTLAITTPQCEEPRACSVDSASLIQLALKDYVSMHPVSLHEAESTSTLPVEKLSSAASVLTMSSSSLSLTKTAGMQACFFLLEGVPKHPKHLEFPASDSAHRSWSRFAYHHHIILCSITVCFIFMCLWAWKETSWRFSKQTHSDSLESEVRRRNSSSNIRPTASEQLGEIGHVSQSSFAFKSEEELLDCFAALRINWRHICIFICTLLSFAGAGAMNDTIGLTFVSFEEEWGVQTPSRLACLSLVSTAGQILSSIFVGEIADSRGRCFVARCASLLVVLCFCFSAMAPSLETLAIARFLGGLGFGALNIAVPTLLSECVPRHARCLLVLYQFGWPLGAAGFTFMMSTGGWRAGNTIFLPGASVILAVFWCPGCIPESPRWLCSQGRLQDAADSVCQHGVTPPLCESTDEALPIVAEEVKEEGESPDKVNATHSFYVHAALSMLCVASASMMIKVWLPAVLLLRGVHSNNMAFVTMWLVEASSICVTGFLFGSPANSSDNDNIVLLRVSQGAMLIASLAVFGYTQATIGWLITFLGGVHLLGQANGCNFLMAFSTLSFPVAVRARCVAGIFLAQYAGCFVGPLLGSVLLQFAPRFGAYVVLSVGGLIYICGFLRSLSLSELCPVH